MGLADDGRLIVQVIQEPFDVAEVEAALTDGRRDVGAVVTFQGRVRGGDAAGQVKSLTLEHYPGMTERQMAQICQQAASRWPLMGVAAVHRVGRLLPGDPIVLVCVASAHRGAAFEAAAFIMDWLKTRAPFWKKEDDGDGVRWVEARDSDDLAAARW